MKLLIIRLSALGDVAMLVPVVKALASQHADLQITVLSMPMMRPVFESIAENVHFIAFDKKGEHKGFKGLNKLYQQLKAERFDAIADCHDVLRTKYLRLRFMLSPKFLFSALCKRSAKKISHIDKHRAGKKALTRQENKILTRQPTSFENYADTIKQLPGLQNLEISTTQTPEPPESRNPQNIGIAPFAAHVGKIYPLSKMLKAIKLLLAKGHTIYLFGAGAKETAVFKQWQQEVNNTESNTENSTQNRLIIASEQAKGLLAEIRLMSTLNCMITMDSGNQHLAAISGTRVVSIWGATHPYAGFLAWGQKPEDCVQKDMPCRPCSIYGNKPCIHKTYPCMEDITPEEIVEKVLNP